MKYFHGSLSRLLAILAFASSLLAACAPKRPAPNTPISTLLDHPDLQKPEPNDIVSVNPPQNIDASILLKNIESSQVVFVGEKHDHDGSHRIQLDIIKHLHKRHGRPGIGIELFRENHQNLLDRYTSGNQSLEDLKQKLESTRTSPQIVDYYHDILDYAKRHDLPLLALKPDRPTVQQQRKELQEKVNEDTETTNPSKRRQNEFLRSMFGKHVPTGAGFEVFAGIQRFWEERMASNIHEYLKQENNPDRLVALTGNYHVAFDFGIPNKLQEHGNWRQTSILTVPVNTDLESFLKTQITENWQNIQLADYIWLINTN